MTQHRRTIAALLPLFAAGLMACGGPTTADAGSGASPASASAAAPAAGTGVDPTLEEPAGLGGVDRFAFDGMASGLREAAGKLERGEDPTFACVRVIVHAEGESAAAMPDAARTALEQCGREIPLGWATRQLDAVEATGNLSQSIGECAHAQVSLDEVAERFTDPRVDEQRARLADLCS
jgi:hypothetical protein